MKGEEGESGQNRDSVGLRGMARWTKRQSEGGGETGIAKKVKGKKERPRGGNGKRSETMGGERTWNKV